MVHGAFPCPAGDFPFPPDVRGAAILQPLGGKAVAVPRGRSVDARFSPCSTFKVVSLLLGLEAGAVSTLSDRLGYDGTRHEIEAWNRDVTLKEAFGVSCVWYFKKVMDRISRERVERGLDRLGYGNRDLSLWDGRGHGGFWLRPGLAISPREQVAVLGRILTGKSGFSQDHISLLKRCMRQDPVLGNLPFYGKTGSGRDPVTGRLMGWFIGFCGVEEETTLLFAAHLDSPERDLSGRDAREWIVRLVREYAASGPHRKPRSRGNDRLK